jgi:hypothetical protein
VAQPAGSGSISRLEVHFDDLGRRCAGHTLPVRFLGHRTLALKQRPTCVSLCPSIFNSLGSIKCMWSADTEKLSSGQILKTRLLHHSRPIAYSDVLRSWQVDAEFRSFFTALLSDAPFEDFRWETQSVSAASANQPFEFVVLNDPGLASIPDPEAFAEHFDKPPMNPDVVSFSNLGRDAVLIVPCPLGPPETYRHLGAFLRKAPEQQKHSFWKAVAEATTQALQPRPIWLSTAGAGVSWLHARIDQRPKYYAYEPYRKS